MKYSKDEALDEIMKRGKIIKKKHDKRNTVILSSATALSAFLLVITVSIFAGGGSAGTYSAYGSFVLNNDSIQYVVEALATFLFGSLITVVIYRIRNSRYTKR
ncbi:MAG: hypothetical protein J5625_04850 [Lachnospiraceae bacterium]|nr:hypothetical protein [Lachnospiraceae bacterium]